MSEHPIYHIDPKAARNRDPEYNIDHTVMVKRLALLGLKDAEIASTFGISLNRLMVWTVEHPELGSALAMGREIADAHVAESVYKRATGYEAPVTKVFKMRRDGCDEIVEHSYMEHIPPDTAAAKFWLTSRRPDLWKDQQHQAVSGSLEVTGVGLSGLLAAAKLTKTDAS
jgi:hypothetical protein